MSARRSLRAYPVKALAIVRGQAIVTVAGKGMVGVHGIAARTFVGGRIGAAVGLDDLPGVVGKLDRLHAAGIRGRSRGAEHPSRLRRRDCERAHRQRHRPARHGGDRRRRRRHGRHARASPRACSPRWRRARINVVAIAQGSSERNISFAVNGDDAAEAARCVHAAFQLSKIGGGRPLPTPHDRRRAARIRPRRPRAGRSDCGSRTASQRARRRAARSIGLRVRAARPVAAAAARARAREGRRRAARRRSAGSRRPPPRR